MPLIHPRKRYKRRRKWKKRRWHKSKRWHGCYEDYLKTAHWRSKRKAFLRRHPQCYVCGINEKCQVHHKTYTRLGHEPDEDLITLCKRHHKLLHKHNLPIDVGHTLLLKEDHTIKPSPKKIKRPKKKSKKTAVTRYYVDSQLLRGKSDDELEDILERARRDALKL